MNFDDSELDVSKINKTSQNDSYMTNPDSDSCILDAINTGGDNLETSYQALYKNQKTNIDNLYQTINNLESTFSLIKVNYTSQKKRETKLESK